VHSGAIDGLIAQRLAEVRRRIEQARGDLSAIRILAATKGRSPEECRAALAAGVDALGENRVQEALPKLAELPEAEWHLIGHLQTNKVKQVVGRFALVESVDSLHLARALAERSDGRQAVLVEVNASREPQKHGFSPEEAIGACLEVAGILELRGVMGMAAATGDPTPVFAALRRIRDEAEQQLGRPLPVLSMGMSRDFEAAVREGSTLLRLGTALFG